MNAEISGNPVEERLRAVYRFASEEITSHLGGRASSLLDVGTYNGFALTHLLDIADRVISIDIDAEKLRQARNRSELAQFFPDRLNLFQMNAARMVFSPATIERGSFDAATIIEVFGAGFEGNGMSDVAEVFAGVSEALKEGGICVFTIRSKRAEEILGPFQLFDDRKGLAVHRRDLRPHLDARFSEIRWYGQQIFQPLSVEGTEGIFWPGVRYWSDDGRAGHAQWSDNARKPRPVDLTKEGAVYWVGVAIK